MYTVTFDAKLKKLVLEAFNKDIDDSGYVVEKTNPTQRVLSPDGEEIKLEDFAGIKNGSEVFIKSDLISLMELCDSLS